MNIESAVVLVTGANRGIGLAFARELLARGARKVYAAARDPATVTLAGVHALRLDVTKPEEIASAAQTAAEEIVQRALDGLAAGADEVLADALTQQIRQGLAAPHPVYLPQTR